MRQSLDNRIQSLEIDTRLSHSKRDLWRPSREEAYLSHIWWRISRGQYCNIGPRVRAALYLAYILITRSEVGVQKEIYTYSGFLLNARILTAKLANIKNILFFAEVSEPRIFISGRGITR